MAAIDQILDALIKRQIGLTRYGAQLTSTIIDLLDASEDELRKIVEQRWTAETRELMAAIKDVRSDVWTQSISTWTAELRTLAKQEGRFVEDVYTRFAPVKLEWASTNLNTLATVVTKRPFQGKLLREWADAEQLADADRIVAAIRIGITNGEDIIDVVRRVIGTTRNDGRDGITQVSRNNVAAISHTSVMNTSQAARDLVFEENSSFFQTELFLAVLDGKTTLFCQAHSGKIYALTTGPALPAHWRCRSMYLPLLDGAAIGDMPAQSFTKDMLDGLTKVERRAKVRELTGSVPKSLSYNDWLRQQSAEFQDDVLGPKRAKIFRSGALTLDRFLDQGGRTLTLKELEAFV
jgi:hypothetical protein